MITVPDTIHVPDLSSIGTGDALIIVPPFAGTKWPSLGVHQIQASAQRAGFDVRILYANLVFAACFGEETYNALGCVKEITTELIGERFFAAAAYGRAPLALPVDGSDDERFTRLMSDGGVTLSLAHLRVLEARARRWVEKVADGVAALGYKVVGASTTFQQTSAAIALLAAVKRRCPETIAILGGANCEGPMAEGIMSIGAPIDYVFSGESEETFVDWLGAVEIGALPPERIIKGRIQLDMDKLPAPDYRPWFAQRVLFLGEESVRPDRHLFVTYETSRGCWWGEKHHCTFCGLNGLGMRYREKNPEKVIENLRFLLAQNPTRSVWIVDNIMPHSYFRTLLPRLQAEVPDVELFYEVKSNLSLERIQLLKQAGVVKIQPGIESLATPLLRLMDKGVTAAQNLALLRYARSVGLAVDWNLLYGYPNDKAEHYEQMLALFPLLAHLQPPAWVTSLRIDRFSPYHESPSRYGVRNIRPLPAYAAVLPPGTRTDLVAYYFLADYESAVDDKLEQKLRQAVTAWRDAWRADSTEPALHIAEARPGVYLLTDTRGLPSSKKFQLLDASKARAALVCQHSRHPSTEQSAALEWALAERVAVRLDDGHVPLATASPELIGRFEAEVRQNAAAPSASRAPDRARGEAAAEPVPRVG